MPTNKLKNKKIGCYLRTRKIGCYLIVIIKLKRKKKLSVFKNNISSYCRSSPSSGQDFQL
jgi:hypothetical protein